MTHLSPPITLRRLGQAGYMLSAPGMRIVFDPFLSDYPGRLIDPPITARDLSEADAILVSHEHLDHLDILALAAMPVSSTRVLVPAPLAERVRAALPGREVIAARPWLPVEIGSFAVVPLPALHGVHMRDAYGFGVDEDGDYPYVGYIVRTGEITVFHAGDGLDYPDLAPSLRRLNVDIALLPINGRDPARESQDIVGNMSAEEAADVAIRAGVSAVVPMHYDMFANNAGPVGVFVDKMRDAAPWIHVLVPGIAHDIPLPASQIAGRPS